MEYNFSEANTSYYNRYRTWPSVFNIRRGARVLDIGCSRGNLGHYLKVHYSCHVTGIDIIQDNIDHAINLLDVAFVSNIETLDFCCFTSKFDYVVFSDSLEHLVNPDIVLSKIKAILEHSGSVLIAVPNIRNFRVTFPLLFSDKWDYTEEGILDKTHLRFYTLKSLTKMLKHIGFTVVGVALDLPASSKVGLLNLLSFGIFRRHLTSHYFIEACLKR